MTILIIIGSVRRFCRRTLFEQGYHREICFAPQPGPLLPQRSPSHHLDTPLAKVPPENAVVPEVAVPGGCPLIRFLSAVPV